MSVALRFELEGVQDKLEQVIANRALQDRDHEIIEIVRRIVARVLDTIDDEPEEHLRKIRAQLANLDVGLAVVDNAAEEKPEGYVMPRAVWDRMMATRDGAVELSAALAEGRSTVPCPVCHSWTAVPREDHPDVGSGRVAMRCRDGHEWQLTVYALPADMRGEASLRFLPKQPRTGDGV